jgi:hypothetical protein
LVRAYHQRVDIPKISSLEHKLELVSKEKNQKTLIEPLFSCFLRDLIRLISRSIQNLISAQKNISKNVNIVNKSRCSMFFHKVVKAQFSHRKSSKTSSLSATQVSGFPCTPEIKTLMHLRRIFHIFTLSTSIFTAFKSIQAGAGCCFFANERER